MVEEALDARLDRAKRQAIADRERGRRRPVLGARMEIARTEDDRDEAGVALDLERARAGEPHLDRRPGSEMAPREARGKRGGVVGDDEVALAKQLDEFASRQVAQGAARIGDEHARIEGTLHRKGSGDHAGVLASAASIASASSRAAASGRFNVARSASGTANAWSGVSMSPGSSDRKRTPSAASSSFQMRLR